MLPRGLNLFQNLCVCGGVSSITCLCIEVPYITSDSHSVTSYRMPPPSPPEVQLDIYRLLIYSSHHRCEVYASTAVITMQLAYLFQEKGVRKHIRDSASGAAFSCKLRHYSVFHSSLLFYPGFRRNEEMRAMEVLPILKEKVAFLSGKLAFILLNYGVKLQPG